MGKQVVELFEEQRLLEVQHPSYYQRTSAWRGDAKVSALVDSACGRRLARKAAEFLTRGHTHVRHDWTEESNLL